MALTGQLTRCIFNPSSGGTGTWTVASAVSGYLTPAQANASDGVIYCYAAELRNVSNVITDWEVGTGTYTVSGTTLTRTPIFSSNSNAAVNFATAPVVMITTIVDATKNYLIAGGGLIANSTAVLNVGGGPARIQSSNNTANEWGVVQYGYGAVAGTVGQAFAKTRGSSETVHSILQAGDKISEITSYGSDGAAYQPGTSVQSFIDGTPATNQMPAGLTFHTNNASTSFTERMRIDSLGRIQINGTVDQILDSTQSQIQIASLTTGSGRWGATFIGYGNNQFTGAFGFAKTRSGTYDGQTAVQSGDRLMELDGYGSDGTGYIFAGALRVDVDGTVATNQMPSRLVFFTNSGTTVVTEAGRIASDQRWHLYNGALPQISGAFARLNIGNSNISENGINVIGYGNTTGATGFELGKTRGGNPSTQTIVNSGDGLCYFLGRGSDGVTFQPAAEIDFEVDAAPSANVMPGRLRFSTNRGGTTVTEALRIDSAGLITVAANGSLKLAAGTTTVAPLVFQSGTNLTTAADGAMEFDGLSLFMSSDASDRRILPLYAYIRQHATFTLTSTTSFQKLFNGSTNGQLTLPTGAYRFTCGFSLTTMSATSGNAAFQIGTGTATVTNALMEWTAIDASTTGTGGAAFQSGVVRSAQTGATGTNMATATTTTEMQAWVEGTFEVSGAGTVIPQIALVTANAAVVQIGSFFECWRMGATTDVVQGNWS